MNITSLIVSHFPKAKQNEPLATYTTFGVGGTALALLATKTPAELVAAVSKARANQIPYVIVAGGSNMIFPDKPYRGLVIVFRQSKLDHTRHCQGDTLTVEASLLLGELIKCAIKNNLAGLESLSGIPGTVGGAVVGNAGAYGQSISDHLVAVEIFDPTGQTLGVGASLTPSVRIRPVWLSKKACRFAYRDSILKHKDWIVLRAKFELEKGDGKALALESREIIKIRNKKYTPGLKCPGSFFKNVLVSKISRSNLAKIDQSKIIGGLASSGVERKIPAGYLLESVGARGMRIGDIYVADFHSNLLVNGGNGTCADVKKLATKLKQKVFKKFGIMLEEEVRYIK